jgi:hypothetical protein
VKRKLLFGGLIILFGALLFAASAGAQGPIPRVPSASPGTGFTYTSHGHKLRFFEGLKIQCDQ